MSPHPSTDTAAEPVTVAVTGGIGAGKSTVSRLLADHGATVVDSDQVARDVVAPDSPGLRQVIETFGPAVLAADGSLDRPAMAQIIFSDSAARERLEAIIHPLVRAEFERVKASAAPDGVVINDIPLLRSATEAAPFDVVVLVTATLTVRLQRLAQRGMTEKDARERIAAQIDDEERRQFADIEIANNADHDALTAQIARVWTQAVVPLISQRRRPD